MLIGEVANNLCNTRQEKEIISRHETSCHPGLRFGSGWIGDIFECPNQFYAQPKLVSREGTFVKDYSNSTIEKMFETINRKP